jgi:virulence-associated protein VagC
MTMALKTTKIVNTPEGPAALLPEGFRFAETTVTIQRDGDAVILEPILPAAWPEGFFEKIRIDDPSFKRPDQGETPPPPVFD